MPTVAARTVFAIFFSLVTITVLLGWASTAWGMGMGDGFLLLGAQGLFFIALAGLGVYWFSVRVAQAGGSDVADSATRHMGKVGMLALLGLLLAHPLSSIVFVRVHNVLPTTLQCPEFSARIRFTTCTALLAGASSSWLLTPKREGPLTLHFRQGAQLQKVTIDGYWMSQTRFTVTLEHQSAQVCTPGRGCKSLPYPIRAQVKRTVFPRD